MDQLKYISEEKVFDNDEDGTYIYGIVLHFENDGRFHPKELRRITNDLL